jgi:hypothetical protein
MVRAEEVHLYDAAPLGVVSIERKRALADHAGAVDEHVDPAERSERRVEQFLHLIRLHHVESIRDRLPSAGFHLRSNSFHLRFDVSSDQDIDAFVREGQADRSTDASSATGHHSNLALQLHRSVPAFSAARAAHPAPIRRSIGALICP